MTVLHRLFPSRPPCLALTSSGSNEESSETMMLCFYEEIRSLRKKRTDLLVKVVHWDRCNWRTIELRAFVAEKVAAGGKRESLGFKRTQTLVLGTVVDPVSSFFKCRNNHISSPPLPHCNALFSTEIKTNRHSGEDESQVDLRQCSHLLDYSLLLLPPFFCLAEVFFLGQPHLTAGGSNGLATLKYFDCQCRVCRSIIASRTLCQCSVSTSDIGYLLKPKFTQDGTFWPVSLWRRDLWPATSHANLAVRL